MRLISTGATASIDRETANAARRARQRGQHDHRAARATTAAAVLSARVSRCTIGDDRSGSRQSASTHQHHAAAGPTGRRSDGVVVAARAAAAAEKDAASSAGYHDTAVSATIQVRRPRVATLSASAAVAATAAARVLIVHGRIAVGSATTGIARCAATEVAVRVSVADGIERTSGPLRSARNALGLLTVGGTRRHCAVVGVCKSGCTAAGALQARAETLTGGVDRCSVEVEVVGDVECDDATARAIPSDGERRRRCRERCRRVLRHADYLEALLTLGRRHVGVDERVDEPAVGAGSVEADDGTDH